MAILSITGCDRQNQHEPQAIAVKDASRNSGQRYVIDRSMAGTPIPRATVRNPQGQMVNLATLAGKPLVLNLWATWCGPCVEELPTLNALADSSGSDLRLVALSQDIGTSDAAPANYVTDRGWSNLQVWRDPDNIVGQLYGGQLPTTIIFAADGREVARVIGPLDWTGTDARSLLAEAGVTN